MHQPAHHEIRSESRPQRAQHRRHQLGHLVSARSVIQQANNLLNTWYSYYDGGQIMGHIMDFAIRHDTNNQKSLDDWMRLLYSRYALPSPGSNPTTPSKPPPKFPARM